MKIFISLFISLLSSFSAIGQGTIQRNFIQQSSQNDLLGNTVNSITQDHWGFLWIGTDNGLSRFDGYSFGLVHGIGDDIKNSPSSNFIKKIYQDKSNRMWIGMNKGICLYNDSNYTFTHFKEFENIYVNTFKEDQNNNIWVGCHLGVCIISRDTRQTHFISVDECPELAGKKVNFITKDQNNSFWISSEYGLHHVSIMESNKVVESYDFSRKQNLLVKSYPIKGRIGFCYIDKFNRCWISVDNKVYITPLPKEKLDLSSAQSVCENEEHLCIYQEPSGNIWIGTRYQGITFLELDAKGEIKTKSKYWINPHYTYDIANTVMTIYGDRWGNIWVGTQNGLYMSKKADDNQFFTVKEGSADNSLSNNIVSGIYQDAKENIWLATAYGINKFSWKNRANHQFSVEHFFNRHDKEKFAQNNRFQSIIEKQSGLFWVSTKNDIICFDSQKGRFFEDAKLNRFIENNELKMARCFYRDKKNNIWIGFETGGIAVYLKEKDDFFLLGSLDKDLQDNDYWAIAEDARGYLWIGSKKDGLYKVKINTDISAQGKLKISSKKHFLPNEWITSICINSDNIPWVGTSSKILRYSSATDDFEQVPLTNAFDNPLYVSGILEDANEGMWICTTKGIYKYVEHPSSSHYYDINDKNLARTNYLFGCLTGKDGSIFLGGINGLTYFYPDDLRPDTVKQEIYITDFQILNKRSIPRQSNNIPTNINLMESLTFGHSDYQFLIEFSTLYLTDPYKIKYTYKLEGFDKDWIYTDARHNYASYSNLPPGKYVLKIRSTNASGMWLNNQKAISIVILPPPWATWWAFCLYILAVSLVAGGGIYIYYVRNIYKQQEKYNHWKSQFYTKVIHGFETPLFLLRMPLENLTSNLYSITKSEIENMLRIMQQNVKQLSHLTKQLGEFQKIDMKKASLILSETDMIPFIQEAYNFFLDVAKEKDIRFEFQHTSSGMAVYIDTEKMEIILFNLLSNAFKFTPENGLVVIHCYDDTEKERIWIEVDDNGIGIEKKHQKQIFQSFYHIEQGENTSLVSTGAGLGLTLAKDFIELHGGRLYVESIPGKGSTFRFFLPKGKAHFDREQIGLHPHKSYIANYIDIEKGLEITDKISKANSNGILPTVFLIEEKTELCNFLKKIMQKYNYQVKPFGSPEQVFQSAVKLDPALIVCSMERENEAVMLSLCKKLKDNIQTCHIPVVLLMGNYAEESEIMEGYEVGADACIAKPFEMSYLMIRIKQLIDIRHSIKEKLKIDESIHSEKERKSASSVEEKFLKKIMGVIEKNMADENFNLEEFAKQINISRSVLNTRIQMLLGQTPIEFVKTVRLKKAAQLLESNAYNVSEISLMVGFTDAGYFSTCFKRQFGETPSEYAKNRKKKL